MWSVQPDRPAERKLVFVDPTVRRLIAISGVKFTVATGIVTAISFDDVQTLSHK